MNQSRICFSLFKEQTGFIHITFKFKKKSIKSQMFYRIDCLANSDTAFAKRSSDLK